MTDMSGFGPVIPPLHEEQRSLRQQVFERVRAAGCLARVEIAKELAISPASVTSISAELIADGLLQEVQQDRDTGRGRPPVAIGVNPDAYLVAGIKVSDLDHTGVISDFSGRVLVSITRQERGPFQSKDDLMALIAGLLDDLCRQASLTRKDLSALGIGMPGFIDHDTGHVIWSPMLWGDGFPLAKEAEAAFGLPTTIDNDANLATLAELWFGEGRTRKDFAVVTIEHGVGMGMVINHRLYRGARGLGMELGHTKVQMDGALCRCGQRGCLEAYVADYAIKREAETALGGRGAGEGAPTGRLLDTLFARAKAGEPGARAVFHRAGRFLSLGLSNVVNIFDPELIILSGARMQYDLLWADDVLNDMRRMMLDTHRRGPDIQVHAGGDLIWARGAAALAIGHLSDAVLGTRKELQVS